MFAGESLQLNLPLITIRLDFRQQDEFRIQTAVVVRWRRRFSRTQHDACGSTEIVSIAESK